MSKTVSIPYLLHTGESIELEAAPAPNYYSSAQIDALGKQWEAKGDGIESDGSGSDGEGTERDKRVRIYCNIVDKDCEFTLPIERIKTARAENPDSTICMMIIINQGGNHWVSLPTEISPTGHITFAYANSMAGSITTELATQIEQCTALLKSEAGCTSHEITIFNERWEQEDPVSCGIYAFENAQRKLSGRSTAENENPGAENLRLNHLSMLSKAGMKLGDLNAIATFPQLIALHNKLNAMSHGFPTFNHLMRLEEEDWRLLRVLDSSNNHINRLFSQLSGITKYSGKTSLAVSDAGGEDIIRPVTILYQGDILPEELQDKVFEDFMPNLQTSIGDDKTVEFFARLLGRGYGYQSAVSALSEEEQSDNMSSLVNFRIRLELIDHNNKLAEKICKNMGLTEKVEAKMKELEATSPKKKFAENFNNYRNQISQDLDYPDNLNEELTGLGEEYIANKYYSYCADSLQKYLLDLGFMVDQGKAREVFKLIAKIDLSEKSEDEFTREIVNAATRTALPRIDKAKERVQALVAENDAIIDEVRALFADPRYTGFKKYYREKDGVINSIEEIIRENIIVPGIEHLDPTERHRAIMQVVKGYAEELNNFVLTNAPAKGWFGLKKLFFGIGTEAMQAQLEEKISPELKNIINQTVQSSGELKKASLHPKYGNSIIRERDGGVIESKADESQPHHHNPRGGSDKAPISRGKAGTAAAMSAAGTGLKHRKVPHSAKENLKPRHNITGRL